jgi:hypothetical protein
MELAEAVALICSEVDFPPQVAAFCWGRFGSVEESIAYLSGLAEKDDGVLLIDGSSDV